MATLKDAIRIAHEMGEQDEAIMVDESWTHQMPHVGHGVAYPPGLVSALLLRDLFPKDRTNDCVLCGRGGHRANQCPTKKTCPMCGKTAELVKLGWGEAIGCKCMEGRDPILLQLDQPKAEPDAVDEKCAPSYAVVRADFHDAVALLHHYASNATHRIDIAMDALPRVVRELAALMTEAQRNAVWREMAKVEGMRFRNENHDLVADLNRKIRSLTGELEAVIGYARIPGHENTQPKAKKELPPPLGDEDLLAADE